VRCTSESELVLAALPAVVHVVDSQHHPRPRQPHRIVHVPTHHPMICMSFTSLQSSTAKSACADRHPWKSSSARGSRQIGHQSGEGQLCHCSIHLACVCAWQNNCCEHIMHPNTYSLRERSSYHHGHCFMKLLLREEVADQGSPVQHWNCTQLPLMRMDDVRLPLRHL